MILSSDEKGIIFNEVADYWKEKTAEISTAQVRGKVITINSVSALQKLSTADKDKLKTGQVIALIEKLKMAVIIQDLIPAEIAGVIFGAKVQTKYSTP